MLLKEIRNKFLQFFSKHKHFIIKSSPLVPHNDPSLMFTNSGMVQFKNIFTGLETPKHSRATTSQKCVRAGGKHNDLDNVGYTKRHHTFFEMLGNFSFGDYFKEEAISMAWDLIIKEFGVNKDKLYITVYHTDNEAYDIWHKLTGFGDDKIIRITTSDNFWSMGDTGPCGPCSEIFFDHGPQHHGSKPGSGDEGDRFVEIWNLVFMQFEQLQNGQVVPLPKKSIDTGMGLERIAAVLQGVNDNFETDLFKNLIAASQDLTGNRSDIISHKVIADHLRSCSFLIADGVFPSNEGRGYVLRRIMRRAMRHVHNLGCKEPVMYRLVHHLTEKMGDDYPELLQAADSITSILQFEEEKFSKMLDIGLKFLNDMIHNIHDKTLSGDIAFKLYDTYGFPLDLTKDILRKESISVDEEGFDKCMQAQKEKAKKAWKGSGADKESELWMYMAQEIEATDFVGYTEVESSARILKIVVNNESVQILRAGENGILILNQTPFYAESGGQVGDAGCIKSTANTLCEVKNTTKYADKIIGHYVVAHGDFAVGTDVVAIVDESRRRRIKAHHSAAHLLHYALQKYLGKMAVQKGSLVNEHKLRFDFAYTKKLDAIQIIDIEKEVNNLIFGSTAVHTKVMPYDIAIKTGAMALFGEKYEDDVRVVVMNPSVELCGGTHVANTGEIGLFKIISEEAIASGIRRIEAVAGYAALEHYHKQEASLKSVCQFLKCSTEELLSKITQIAEHKQKLEKKCKHLQINAVVGCKILTEKLTISSKTDAPGIDQSEIKFYFKILPNTDIENLTLQDLGNAIKERLQNNFFFVFGVQEGNQCSIMLCVDAEVNKFWNIDADLIATKIKEKFGGNGGGNKLNSYINGAILAGHNVLEAIKREIIEGIKIGCLESESIT